VAAVRLLVSFSAEEVAAVLLVMDFAGVKDSVMDIVKPSNSNKGFLRRGFFNSSPAVKVSTHTSLLESVMSSSTLHVKEDGVVGIPSPSSGSTIENGDDFRVNGLSQSQKWLVFGSVWGGGCVGVGR
jgi:hypothetical protein